MHYHIPNKKKKPPMHLSLTATMKGCPLVTAEGELTTRQQVDTDDDAAATVLNDPRNSVC